MTIATWAKALRPSFFRTVPFEIKSHTFRSGRRNQQHNIQGKETPFNEDLGKESQGFNVEGFATGDAYFATRDALIDALEQPGPGLLSHAYLGVKTVVVDSFEITEDSAEGRIFRFSAVFVEAGEPAFPFTIIDQAVGLFGKAILVIEQAEAFAKATINLSQLPNFAVNSFATTFLDSVNSVKLSVETARFFGVSRSDLELLISDVEESLQTPVQNKDLALSQFSLLVGAVGDSVITSDPETNQLREDEEKTDRELTPGTVENLALLAGTPLPVEDSVSLDTVDAASSREDEFLVFDNLSVFGEENFNLPENTSTRITEKKNNIALTNFVRQTAIAQLVFKVGAKNFETLEEAFSERERLVSLIDFQLRQDLSDELHDSLYDLKQSVIDAVPNPSSNITSIETLEIEGATNPLLLSYNLFGNLGSTEDIISRNRLSEPSFIAAGEALEVKNA